MICRHCAAGVPIYEWQGEKTHRIWKKISPTTTHFSHVICEDDPKAKKNERPGSGDKLLQPSGVDPKGRAV